MHLPLKLKEEVSFIERVTWLQWVIINTPLDAELLIYSTAVGESPSLSLTLSLDLSYSLSPTLFLLPTLSIAVSHLSRDHNSRLK